LKFPGLKLWAASYMPYIISLVRCSLIRDEVEMHHEYGDVVRLGPNEISDAK
jgi:hypothetical protein